MSRRAIFHDDSLTLLRCGYDFGATIWRRARPGARSAPMSLLGRDALLVRGAEGVAHFYDEDRVSRDGAMPMLIRAALFGRGSVHGLDGPAHRRRKATFVDLAYDDAQVRRLIPHLEDEWRSEVDAWIGGGRRSAYQAAVGAFGRASMRWAGLPGTPAAMTRWSARLAQIVDGFGVPYSPQYLLAVMNRFWSNRHAAALIRAARSRDINAPVGTALHHWAWHRDEHGRLLSPALAGVELQNSIRPMVAVARFVAFAAKELHDHPQRRQQIADEAAGGVGLSGLLATAFAQEIRRTAPFVPMLPGIARVPDEIDGRRIKAGDRIVLDILGTNTDPLSWSQPTEFGPERFVGIEDYEAIPVFVPHGGGDVRTGHRCPGEKLAIAGLATAISALSDPRLTINDKGLKVNRRRLPTKPSSGGIIAPADTPRGCPAHQPTAPPATDPH